MRALLVLAFVGALLAVAADLGLERWGVPPDEVSYHEAARRHVAWLGRLGRPGAFSPETLAHDFPLAPAVVDHPNFSRWLSGLSWRLLHGVFGVDEVVAFRAHLALVYALLALGVVLESARRGAVPAAVGLLLFASSVRLFGHAHVALTDLVLACTWLWAALLLARAMEGGGLVWLGAAAVVSGLALATKLSGLQLVLLLAAWPVWAQGRRGLRAAALLLVGPILVFTLLHPQSWPDPVGWWRDFAAMFAAREEQIWIPTFFLGRRYGHRLPWFAPLVHLALTVSPAVLALAALAGAAAIRQWLRAGAAERLALLRGRGALLAAAGLSPIAVVCWPSIPAHDVERLFLHAQPFLVVFAAGGFAVMAQSAIAARVAERGPPPLRAAAPLLLAALLCGPPLVEAWRQYPYALAYWNLFVGGAPGAERHGFDVAYLKTELNGRALRSLDAALPANARLYANFLARDLAWHQRAGRLRRDVRLVRDRSAGYALLHARRGWMTQFELGLWQSPRPPVWVLRHRGVDLIRLYRLDPPGSGPAAR